MPTTVTKTIGATSSPTVPDYTSWASWIAGCPANLVTADQIWDGAFLDQGEFSIATAIAITGITTDATRYVKARCATGASFRDKAGVRSTALAYNANNGVATKVTANYIDIGVCNVEFTQFIGLQFQCTGNGNSNGFIVNADNGVVDSCIVQRTQATTATILGVTNNAVSVLFKNCLAIFTGAGSGFSLFGRSSATGFSPAYGCTSIGLSGQGANYALENYGTARIIDCAGFGAANFSTGNAGSGISSNNATNQATGFGTSNQTSLTFASQFVSTTTDFRAVGTGSLDLNGITDANTLTDISNTARSVSTPTIGCWEVVSGTATYTATAAFTINHCTLSASSTFAAGTKTAIAAFTINHCTLSASSTFSPGTKTATAALSINHATLSASSTFVGPPNVTGTAVLNINHSILAAISSVVNPAYTGTSILTVAKAILSAVASFFDASMVGGEVFANITMVPRVSASVAIRNRVKATVSIGLR